jgi:hypothetical protein
VLNAAADEVGLSGAIDALNVDLDVRGAVRVRDGYDNFTSSELTNQPDSITAYYRSNGDKLLLVGNGNRVESVNTSGAVVNTTTSPTANPHFFARFGGPALEAIYFANGTDQIRKFSTSVGFSEPGGLSGQTGKFLAVTPTSNRLVVARETGTTGGSNPSSVSFSNAGLPETFTATDFVDLDPGDGEAIMGMVAWRDFVFVFKESKFWVHYGESTDATGGAVFNFRKVPGQGLAASRAVVAGRDGVYFLSRSGVYRTTGGHPELVSARLDPLFYGAVPDAYQGDEINQGSISTAAMTWLNERLYLSVPTGSATTNDRMLVYDPRYDYWLPWNVAAAALCPFRIGNGEELVFAYPTGANHLGRHSPSFTTDDGTAIASRYRTGFYDHGVSVEKRMRAATVWGTGTVSLKMSKDFGALDTARSLTLGTSPAIDRASTNCAKDGELFSHEFSATSGQWAVHRSTFELMGDSREPGAKS